MNPGGIDVNKIHIIIKKTEKYDLNFHNNCRAGDGFVAVFSGKGIFKDADNNVYRIKAGDIVLLKNQQKYYMYFEKGSTYITSAYHISIRLDDNFPAELPSVITGTQNQLNKISKLADIWQSKTWDSYTKCRILLIDFYLDIIKAQMWHSFADNDVRMAMKYIHENFKRNFSGQEIAQYCSVSLSHLRNKFLKQTGMTITKYRDNLRIENAEEMLRTRMFTIGEVADYLGYCDVYHFSKRFKKTKGVSPSSIT